MKKKGLSPVIASVLLIAIVVVIALIIFMWFRGISEEAITKFGDKNVKLVCGDVKFEATYSNDFLSISNTGNVPIYNMNVRILSPGAHTTDNLKAPKILGENDWPGSGGLNQGAAFSAQITIPGGATEINLIPILLGKSDKGEEIYECEDRYGFKISLS